MLLSREEDIFYSIIFVSIMLVVILSLGYFIWNDRSRQKKYAEHLLASKMSTFDTSGDLSDSEADSREPLINYKDSALLEDHDDTHQDIINDKAIVADGEETPERPEAGATKPASRIPVPKTPARPMKITRN